jgi:hypothetical protein
MRVGISFPKFKELKLDCKLYEHKLINALRLYSITAKKGTIFIEVEEKSIKGLLHEMRKKPFESGECEEE